jgi:uncharacterized glyoxalase superfamily protein PhnB
MKLSKMRPMLWVDDVRKTIDWYKEVLGFEETNYVEDWQWGVVKRDEILIMLARPNEHTPFSEPVFTGSLYINTDDVNAWWKMMKDSPHIYYPLETFEYGMKEFAIKDCNGYILQFGQDVTVHDEEE